MSSVEIDINPYNSDSDLELQEEEIQVEEIPTILPVSKIKRQRLILLQSEKTSKFFIKKILTKKLILISNCMILERKLQKSRK